MQNLFPKDTSSTYNGISIEQTFLETVSIATKPFFQYFA